MINHSEVVKCFYCSNVKIMTRMIEISVILYSHWIGLSPCQHVKVWLVRRSFRCLARKADFPEEPPLREEGGTIPKISLLLVVFSGRLNTSSAWYYIWLHPLRGMALDPGDQLRVEKAPKLLSREAIQETVPHRIVLYSHWIGLSPCQHVKVRQVLQSYQVAKSQIRNTTNISITIIMHHQYTYSSP